jgi:hypothetical protein
MKVLLPLVNMKMISRHSITTFACIDYTEDKQHIAHGMLTFQIHMKTY